MYEGSGYKYNCFFYNFAYVLKFRSGVSWAIAAQVPPRLRTKVTHIFSPEIVHPYSKSDPRKQPKLTVERGKLLL